MMNKDRAKLAKLVGWKLGPPETLTVQGQKITMQRWFNPAGHSQGPTAVPNPLNNASDDHALLKFMRNHNESYKFQEVADQIFHWNYEIGDNARAALQVLETMEKDL